MTTVPLSHPLSLCPGGSVSINGQTYTAPAIVLDTLPGIQGCDTIVTYTIEYAPYDLVFHTDSLSCQNGQTDLHYTLCNLGSSPLPTTVTVAFYDADPTTGPAALLGTLTISPGGTNSCFSGTYADAGSTLNLPDGTAPLFSVVNFDGALPPPFLLTDLPPTDIEECNYENNLSSTVVRLPLPPPLDLGPDRTLCQDSTVTFAAGPDFVAYLWHDGSTAPTFSTNTGGLFWVEATDACGTVQRDSVTLAITPAPDVQLPDAAICPGESVQQSLTGFDTYDWAPAAGLNCTDCPTVTIQPDATTTYIVTATTAAGCVARDTFVVEILPLNARAETIEFCPGESVLIGGQTYTAPAIVLDTLPGIQGCDTVVTYTLQYTDGSNSTLAIQCPGNSTIIASAGAGGTPVPYNLPTFSGDCPCPGTTLTRTQGPPSGDFFPTGATMVCYQAEDVCGNVAQCCFTVTVSEETPCDVKEIGCMKYELLGITQNIKLERTYSIRVTNKCPNPMTYTAIQLPNGVTARAPKENTVFTTSPGNRDYLVRNPNFSPFYSIRFKSINDSIANGQSDVFRYTLPPQSQPVYIHIASRLEPQTFFEAHLNTFYCPVVQELQSAPVYPKAQGTLWVFPNPTTGSIYADLAAWDGEIVHARILHGTGQLVQSMVLTAEAAPQLIVLPENLPTGLYFLDVQTAKGERQTVRFVVQP